jgi:hypothetical protein
MATTKEREAAKSAEHQRIYALETVRSRRQQLSALQTAANAFEAEASFERTRR